jgi:predicted transcriptional regulator YdeE
MKITNYIYLLSFASILIIGCNSKTDVNPEEDQVQDNIVSKFLIDVKSLESDTNTNPIVAFKDLAEEIAEDKMIVSKKNIKKVLIKSKEYSNCVIVTGNHTIVKILSFDNCQQSGSWKACMPTVEGYIKKGKLNYKKDFMNNVIGKPDKQERVAYFFKNETMKEKKSDSYEQATPLTYHENGKIKVSGHGYKKFYRYFVSAKDGIDLMESSDLNSKKIANIPNNTELWIESKDGKWLYIYTVFNLSPGDEGYYNDLIDPSELNGYVMNKLIETELDSINKPGVWTYFFESGEIEREEFHFTNFIKKIYYDKKGFITKIEERDGDENSPFGWGPDIVSNTFHKNGKIDCIHEGSGGGATSWCFDEYGGELFSYNYDPDYHPFILSKDIRDFYLRDSEKILNEIKTLSSSEYNDEEKIEINAAEEDNIISNLIAHYKFDRNLNDEIGNSTITAHDSEIYTEGIFKEGLKTDGNKFTISSSTLVNLVESNFFTITFWMKITELDSSQTMGIIARYDSGGNPRGGFNISLKPTNANPSGVLRFERLYDSNTWSVNLTKFSFINNYDKWIHISVTCNDSGSKIYINGKLDNEEKISSPWTSTTDFVGSKYENKIGIGAYLKETGFMSNYNGYGIIDDLKFYNIELNPFNIYSIYKENIIPNEETVSKQPNYYICYNENNNENLQLWIGFDEKAKASKVKYKGMNLDMDLVFVKEVNENEGGPYPVLAEYYNEIYEEKVNGVYKLTKSGNWYYAEYTRKSDNKKFNFTIDIKANNFSDSPCF